jgi:hypothetical protein
MGISDRLRAELITNVPVMRLMSSGGTIYFGIGQANEVADWLTNRGVIIIGIEGFACDGKTIRPLTDYIADFSAIEGGWADRLAAGRRAAKEILPKWASDVEFVDFVLEDE